MANIYQGNRSWISALLSEALIVYPEYTFSLERNTMGSSHVAAYLAAIFTTSFLLEQPRGTVSTVMPL